MVERSLSFFSKFKFWCSQLKRQKWQRWCSFLKGTSFPNKLVRESTKTGNEGKINHFPTANQEENKIINQAFMNLDSSCLTDFSRKNSISTKSCDNYLNVESLWSSSPLRRYHSLRNSFPEFVVFKIFLWFQKKFKSYNTIL